ncbi:MAG: T9SS type A sorting domain-containing protein, partial [Chitinophagales bacterium]
GQGWTQVYSELSDAEITWSVVELPNNTYVATIKKDLCVQVDSLGDVLYIEPDGSSVGYYEDRSISPTPLDNGNYNIFVKGGIIEVAIGDSIVKETFFEMSTDSLAKFGRPHPTLDGGYLLYGSVPYPPNSYWFGHLLGVAKYDSTYQLEWVNYMGELGTYREATDLVMLPDSSYMMSIHQNYDSDWGGILEQIGGIMKISSTGDSLWTKYPDLSQELYPTYLEDISPTSDGNYVATGKARFLNPEDDLYDYLFYVVKFSIDGEKIWSQVYSLGNNNTGRRIIELDNQDCLIVGSGPGADVALIRIDSMGDKLWHRLIDFYNPDLLYTSDYATTVVQTVDKGFILGGNTNYSDTDSKPSSFFLLKTDSLGNCYPYTAYSYTSDPSGTMVNFMNESWGADSYLWDFGDGTTSTAEQSNHIYATQGQYLVCLKAKNLCDSTEVCQIVTAGQIVGIAENENNFAIQVITNPVQDVLTLQGNFTAQTDNDIQIRLYHSSGSQVYTTKLSASVSTFQHQIPVADLPSGIYFLQVQGKKSNVVQKVVVQ